MDIYCIKGMLRWIIQHDHLRLKGSQQGYVQFYDRVLNGTELCRHIDINKVHPNEDRKAEIIIVYGDKCGNCGPTIIATCVECSFKMKEIDWWGTSQCEGMNIIEIHDTSNGRDHPIVYSYNEYHKKLDIKEII